MKKLFVLALMSGVALAAAATAAKPAKKPAAPPPAEPAAPRPPTPGFWERAWHSTKKGSQRVWNTTKRVGEKTADVVTSPFGGGDKKAPEAKTGWQQLAMSMVLDPPMVKLPDTRAVRVTVTVANKGKYAVQLDFPTTQRIEVLVKSDAEKVLSKWSEDQKVDAEQGFIVVNPEERLEYSVTVSTREMAAGQGYRIEAYFPDFDQLRTSRVVSPTK